MPLFGRPSPSSQKKQHTKTNRGGRSTTSSAARSRLDDLSTIQENSVYTDGRSSVARIVPYPHQVKRKEEEEPHFSGPIDVDDIEEKLRSYKAARKREQRPSVRIVVPPPSPRTPPAHPSPQTPTLVPKSVSKVSLSRTRSDSTPVTSNRGFDANERIIENVVAEEEEGDDYSMTAASTADGQGFELRKRRNALGGEEDEDDNGSLDLDVVSRINASDKSLMDRSESPGAIRLTEEGLKHHETKAVQQKQGSDPLQQWTAPKKIAVVKRTRSRSRSGHLDRVSEVDESAEQSLSDKSGTPARLTSSFRIFCKREEEDVGDFSLAPLTKMDNLTLRTPSSSEKKKKGMGLFRKRATVSSKAEELLEKERLAARESEKIREEEERQRIELKKQAFLERERLKNASKAATPPPPLVNQRSDFSASSESTGKLPSPGTAWSSFPCFFTDVEKVGWKEKSEPHLPCLEPSLTESTYFSSREISTVGSSASALPPCVVCRSAERSHIATPCMHFAFCAECSSKLQKTRYPSCPVCNESNVKFAPVSF